MRRKPARCPTASHHRPELRGGPERGHRLAPEAPGSRRKCPAPRPTCVPPCLWFWGADFLLAHSSLPIRVSQPHNDLTVLSGLFGRLLLSPSPGPSTCGTGSVFPAPLLRRGGSPVVRLLRTERPRLRGLFSSRHRLSGLPAIHGRWGLGLIVPVPGTEARTAETLPIRQWTE